MDKFVDLVPPRHAAQVCNVLAIATNLEFVSNRARFVEMALPIQA